MKLLTMVLRAVVEVSGVDVAVQPDISLAKFCQAGLSLVLASDVLAVGSCVISFCSTAVWPIIADMPSDPSTTVSDW